MQSQQIYTIHVMKRVVEIKTLGVVTFSVFSRGTVVILGALIIHVELLE